MRRIARILVIAAAMALLAAGCGKSSGQSVTAELSPKAILARAADATVAAESARMRFTIDMHGLPGQGDITMHGDGAMDFVRHIGSMTVEMPDLGAGLSGDMQVVMDGTVMYMKVPLPKDTAGVFGGKSWMRMDLKDAAQYTGVDPTQQMWSDPRQSLAMLEGVSGGVDVIGEDDIDGAHTTHYHADVDVREAAAKAGAIVDEDRFQKMLSMMGDKIPMDVWIDDDNQVRRMKMDMTISGATASFTTEMYDFGADVNITPPPADQVMDMSDLMRKYGGDLPK